MNLKELKEVFEKYDDDYLEFEKVKNKLSRRPDLHAFILLDQLVPGKSDMISAAEHDEFFLDVDAKKLAKAATEEQIRDLVRCGVRYSEENDSLAMFA